MHLGFGSTHGHDFDFSGLNLPFALTPQQQEILALHQMKQRQLEQQQAHQRARLLGMTSPLNNCLPIRRLNIGTMPSFTSITSSHDGQGNNGPNQDDGSWLDFLSLPPPNPAPPVSNSSGGLGLLDGITAGLRGGDGGGYGSFEFPFGSGSKASITPLGGNFGTGVASGGGYGISDGMDLDKDRAGSRSDNGDNGPRKRPRWD